ncbi:MAG: OmpH family outer membrane protein [Acidocella sp.]|nr:OmpH family outer membrane protein [Acidocella sp.]MDE8349002.1 OmpH family outer membrane protein [Acidocella sp.]
MFTKLPKILAVSALILALAAPAALAQSSPGYFIPPAAPQGGPVPSHPAPAKPAATPMSSDTAAADAADAQAQPKMPPIPQLPALSKAAPPPVAVIGVLSVPEVMQKSTAAQGVQKVIQDRRAKLAAEAQKDQAGWQAEQAKITAERSTLTEVALEAKEKALQGEIAAAQTSFRARDQAIQNSAQAALGEIESTLIAVIRQVADEHGMNLVLHREQVALNVSAFDITDEVATQLNKQVTTVPVPPSVVTPGMPISSPDGNGQGNAQ